MYAVDECLGIAALDFTDEFGNSAVGQQHELLDQLVGILGLLEEYAYGMSCLVYVKTDLYTVKTQGSVLETFCTQYLGKTVQGHYLCLELIARQFILTALLLTLNDCLNLLIGKTAVAAYHGACYAGAFYHAGIGHFKYNGVCEFILILTQ